MNKTKSNQPKKPPVTHFLCLPLINAISLPQLESSLGDFKATIPLDQRNTHPLIPHDAIRPVGTLHLTLGVMSLPSQERLDEAMQFFGSLDLISLMRQAEERTTVQNGRPPGSSMTRRALESSKDEQYRPTPFTISLESLHALPDARSATVLHAAPVDPTGRLYPFCKLLRDKFTEAGFMQVEYEREKRHSQLSSSHGTHSPTTTRTSASAATERISAPQPKLKPRPLLLHATVVNTVYIRGKKQSRGGHRGGRNTHHRQSNDRYTFDARDILSHYRNFYVDRKRVEGQAHPFVWAKNFPIDSVCICEMGAKKLNPDGDRSGMNARLGEKYLAIAERSLDIS